MSKIEEAIQSEKAAVERRARELYDEGPIGNTD